MTVTVWSGRRPPNQPRPPGDDTALNPPRLTVTRFTSLLSMSPRQLGSFLVLALRLPLSLSRVQLTLSLGSGDPGDEGVDGFGRIEDSCCLTHFFKEPFDSKSATSTWTRWDGTA